MLTRRQFMGMGILALGGLGVAGEWWVLKSARDLRRLGRNACALLGHPEGVMAVGRFYLGRTARPPRRSWLLHQLFRSWIGSSNPTPEEVRAYLQQRLEEDYEKDRTVPYEGWVLSETEARLCALYVVMQPAPDTP